MPIRLTCPSCSATLSVKDEHAGRAVKCPKCGGIIPAAQPAAPSAADPPPPPTTEAAPPDDFDEPRRPAKTGGKITGVPVSRSKGRDAAADDKPRRTNRDDDAAGDRPAKRRGRDADDDGPRGRKPAGKSKTGIILVVIAGVLLLCCGGVGFAGWWVYNRIEEDKRARESGAASTDKVTGAGTRAMYDRLQVGKTTRAEADAMLGGRGKIATDADLMKAFAVGPAPRAPDAWYAKTGAKRVFVWLNGGDYLIAAFHPTADGTARLQAKELRPKSGAGLKDGELDDAKFEQQYPPGGESGIPVTAEDLGEAYLTGVAAADEKYKNKVVLVDGKVADFGYGVDGELQVLLQSVPGLGREPSVYVRCAVAPDDVNRVLTVSRGQTIKLRGMCAGFGGARVDVTNATFNSAGIDPHPSVTAARLIVEYGRDAEAADEKYKGKPITITEAVVESKEGEASLILNASFKKGPATRIKVTMPLDARKQLAGLKPGDKVKVKGEYAGSSEKVILVNRAWIVP